MLKKRIKNIARKILRNNLYGKYVKNISNDPLNSCLHFEYAVHCLKKKKYYLALAELKTAEFLGANSTEIKKYKDIIISMLPPQETMNHNQFFRFKTLARELLSISSNNDFSVLDVGGGMGELASFIPTANYCLVEPDLNGISGTDLPFNDDTFDYVVSCHVLEHIPIKNRTLFLNQLISKSKYGLILLNPFYIEGSHEKERLELVLDVTGAAWAQEHLDCTLPRLEYIKDYAEENKLNVSITPSGTLSTTYSLVFMDYFYNASGLKKDWEKVNKFFNKEMNYDLLNSIDYPTAYLVYLSRKNQFE